MFALARLLVMGFVILTIIYVCLSFYSRAVRRGKLRDEWHEGPQDVDQDTFVEQGLTEYDSSLKRKLIWGVYVVPMVLMGTIIYLTNHG